MLIDDRASVQFRDSFLYRVIRPHEWSTYEGWIWLDGYQLDGNEAAQCRRSIFVRLAGIVYVHRNRIHDRPPNRVSGKRWTGWTPGPRTYIDVDPEPA